MTLMAVEIFNVVIWTIIGVATLMSKKVSKFDYVLTWSVLMVHLIAKCFI